MSVCLRCFNCGFLLNLEKREWDVCDCPAGRAVSEEINEGRRDIEAGRLIRWEDVKRTHDRHWPVGLDEEPTLQVQNRLGDARRVR